MFDPCVWFSNNLQLYQCCSSGGQSMSDVKETHTAWKSVSSAVSLMYLMEVSQ